MKWNVFSFAFCTFFKIFHVRLGKKSKSVSFSRVYVCVKAKITLVSFFLLFFFAPSPKNGHIWCTFFSDCGDSLQKERRCRAHVPGINNEIKLKQTSVSFKRNYESACCQPVFILTGRKQNLGRLPVQAQTVTMRKRVILQAGHGLASTCKVKNCRIIKMIIIIFFFLQDGKKNHFTMELSFSSSSIRGRCTDSKVDKCSHCWQTLKAGKLKPGRGRVWYKRIVENTAKQAGSSFFINNSIS